MLPGDTAPTFPSAPLPPYLDDAVGTYTVRVLFILWQSYQFFHDRIDWDFDWELVVDEYCCRRIICVLLLEPTFLIICVLLPFFPSLFVLAGYCEVGVRPVSSFVDASTSPRYLRRVL